MQDTTEYAAHLLSDAAVSLSTAPRDPHTEPLMIDWYGLYDAVYLAAQRARGPVTAHHDAAQAMRLLHELAPLREIDRVCLNGTSRTIRDALSRWLNCLMPSELAEELQRVASARQRDAAPPVRVRVFPQAPA